MKYSPGRYVYGLASIGSGICALVWHDFIALGDVPHREILIYIVAAIEILGGVAVLWPRTARAGAVALGAIYLIFALLEGVPLILEHPLGYGGYGNFFLQFSLVSGGRDRICVFRSNCPGSNGKIGPDRVLLVWHLHCFVHFVPAFLSLGNGESCSQMDSAGTDVLGGGDHGRVCACRDRSTDGFHGLARGPIDHGDDRGFRVADMAAGALCQSP